MTTEIRPQVQRGTSGPAIYVDESIHDGLGFIAIAFVFGSREMESAIAKALSSAGMIPGLDEFKSGSRMEGNESMQHLREALLRLPHRVAILITPAEQRRRLGSEAMKILASIARKNAVALCEHEVFVDQGIFQSENEVKLAAAEAGIPNERLHAASDSRTVLGLQVADAVAHATAQVVREVVTGTAKMLDLGGEANGYPEGTEAELGWILKMTLREAFFVRPVVMARARIDPDSDMEPLVVSNIDDWIEHAQHPELLGWGAFVSDGCSDELRAAVRSVFGRIWLGCAH